MAGPIGIVKMYASTMIDPSSGILSVPEAWLLCDGRSYKKSEYSALYKFLLRNPSIPFDSITNPLIYGGDQDNFNVPNLANRFVRGWNPDATPSRVVGQDIQESVNLANITAQVSTSSLSFGSNQPYSLTGVSIGAAGRHNHRYATSSGTDTGRAELGSTEGFFHRKAETEAQETGGNFITHVRPQDHGNTSGSPCNLHFGAERMWSVSQNLGNSILEPNHRVEENEETWDYRPFRSEKLFGDSNNGYPYTIPDEYVTGGTGVTTRWRWGNTNFRHNHKYNLVVNNAGGHTHSITMSSNDSHTHTLTTTPVISKVGNSQSAAGATIRPKNTKMVYIIYTGVK